MRVVLDTSAAMDIVLHAPGGERYAKALEDAEWIEVPDLYVAEAANVCWKRHKKGEIGLKHCEVALEQALALPNAIAPTLEFYHEAFSLAVQSDRAVYDMFFLALARRRDAVLFSSDKGLLAFAAKHGVKTLK